ncbi:MAG: oxidoreductase domain protein [Bacteroidetes bacterium]|jgi:predicted dehydrogenase|nr:oxidoreductase domain protein [Bacteroidota bacterium]
MEKTRLGIVGLGWIAQVVHLPILLKSPDVEVVAACDMDRRRGKLVAEKFGIPHLYNNIQQMLDGVDLSAVIVATSTDAHKEVTLASLRAGKDVLVEKPIARRYSEAVEMAEAAKAHKRKLMVGMNHRFRPDTMILKSFIEGNELGQVYFVRTGWLRKRNIDTSWIVQKDISGGGVFLDLGIVMLDMALWMMGYPVVKRVGASHYNHKTHQVEDTSLVSLTLGNGSRIHIEVSWSMYLEDDLYFCHVFGSDGTATLNPLRVNKELHGSLVNLAPAKIESPQHLFKRSYENELKHFLGAIRGVHTIVSTADEAVQRMRVADAVYRSARLGKEIVLT